MTGVPVAISIAFEAHGQVPLLPEEGRVEGDRCVV